MPIKTAKEWGWSPTAVLTGSKKVHKHHKHDQTLAMALHIIEEEKCQSCGLPIWIAHSEDARLSFELDHIVCYSCEFEDQETSKKSYNRKKGHTPYVRPIFEDYDEEGNEIPDAELPTRTDYLEAMVAKAISAAEAKASVQADENPVASE